mmetsp:Transcript_9686/g.15597  ORF Transcript_9686/g.15597 Transcript_9686/m.15597 type:complete len:111 (+) Transcript_9686:25-357(+)
MNKASKGLNGKSNMKDYGNIISSGQNSVDHLVDDLYTYQYELKTKLPLDIIHRNKSDGMDNTHDKDDKDIDFSVLTKVLLPSDVLNSKENNSVWTFDSILKDLQNVFHKN